ncbi:hypothetical protein HQ487_03280 [Candidatus Uhrbacteria bacterium]|nr:hypothetical protein [Candidatus Uhrbacteria bacterium]
MITSLGDIISQLYEYFLVLYRGDEELACLATAEVVNRILKDQKEQMPSEPKPHN